MCQEEVAIFTNMGAKQFSSKNIQAELNNRWEHRLFPIWKIIWRQKLRKIVVAPKEKEMPCSSIYTLVRILHNAQEYCTWWQTCCSRGEDKACVKMVAPQAPHKRRHPLVRISTFICSSPVKNLHPFVFFLLGIKCIFQAILFDDGCAIVHGYPCP